MDADDPLLVHHPPACCCSNAVDIDVTPSILLQPEPVPHLVCQLLPAKDLAHVSATCRTLRCVALRDDLWENLFTTDSMFDAEAPTYSEVLTAMTITGHKQSWREVYAEQAERWKRQKVRKDEWRDVQMSRLLISMRLDGWHNKLFGRTMLGVYLVAPTLSLLLLLILLYLRLCHGMTDIPYICMLSPLALVICVGGLICASLTIFSVPRIHLYLGSAQLMHCCGGCVLLSIQSVQTALFLSTISVSLLSLSAFLLILALHLDSDPSSPHIIIHTSSQAVMWSVWVMSSLPTLLTLLSILIVLFVQPRYSIDLCLDRRKLRTHLVCLAGLSLLLLSSLLAQLHVPLIYALLPCIIPIFAGGVIIAIAASIMWLKCMESCALRCAVTCLSLCIESGVAFVLLMALKSDGLIDASYDAAFGCAWLAVLTGTAPFVSRLRKLYCS